MAAAAPFRIETPEAFKVAEAARRLALGRTATYNEIKRGRLHAVLVASELRVPADAIVAYLNQRLVCPRVINPGRPRGRKPWVINVS